MAKFDANVQVDLTPEVKRMIADFRRELGHQRNDIIRDVELVRSEKMSLLEFNAKWVKGKKPVAAGK